MYRNFGSKLRNTAYRVLPLCLLLITGCATGQPATPHARSSAMPVIDADPQPLAAQALRLKETLEYLGSALAPEDAAALEALAGKPLEAETAHAIQDILDGYCLAAVNINPEARVKVMRGPAEAVLQQGGWKNYLVKVHNESGTRAALAWESPNAQPVFERSTGSPEPDPRNEIPAAEIERRFLELQFYDRPPFSSGLSGAAVEYRVLQVYTTAEGAREAQLGFHVGQGTQDLGQRSSLPILFSCRPSVKVTLRVKDVDGSPAMASFIFRDNIERGQDDHDYRAQLAENSPWQRPGLSAKPLTGIYPLPSRRVADHDEYPDFFFQPQVYRADGEHVLLPPGRYDVTWTRGPEYLPQTRTITVPDAKAHTETFKLERWIHLADLGWFSGDHHVHAGGCSHYESPEAGVKPESMLRQAQGEDLNVSCVLTWGPCWYHQKSFFEGKISALSTRQNLMRYDVEVSGFPSSHAGHLCLLRLQEDDYPGTTEINEWPSWTLPVLHWGSSQGGVVGYSHSGWGLEPVEPVTSLPNYALPKMDGIGANEYIVTAVADAVDFISAGDTPLPWELNIWYHTLNCGLRVGISGETDFPCIFDDRVGMARSYAKLKPPISFDAFAEAIRDQSVYVSDGLSHLIDFTAASGSKTATTGQALALDAPGKVLISVTAAAMLPEQQDEAGAKIAEAGPVGRPYWHLEKAREGDTRLVPVELVVNGYPVARQDLLADGTPRELQFEADFPRSGWAALRVAYSSHTNPIYITVGDAPVRASKRSAQWCRAAVDRCWEMKQPAIRQADGEHEAAAKAYDAARAYYDQAIAEAADDTDPATPVAQQPVQRDEAIVLRQPDGDARKRWNFTSVQPGRYTLFVRADENAPAGEVEYRIEHARGGNTVKAPAADAADEWLELGSYRLDANSTLEIRSAPGAAAYPKAVLLAPEL